MFYDNEHFPWNSNTTIFTKLICLYHCILFCCLFLCFSRHGKYPKHKTILRLILTLHQMQLRKRPTQNTYTRVNETFTIPLKKNRKMMILIIFNIVWCNFYFFLYTVIFCIYFPNKYIYSPQWSCNQCFYSQFITLVSLLFHPYWAFWDPLAR